MSDAGRPTDCTEPMIAELCEWLAKGCSIKVATKICGISMATWSNWHRRGSEGEQPFSEFVNRTTRAIGDGLASRVGAIAGSGDWRADAWMLERMHPDEFGKRTEITGADGGPVQVHDVTAAIDAELARRSAADLGIPVEVLSADGDG